MDKIPCSVEILTLNSAQTLSRCLESVRAFDDIIILDGNSTDDTMKIAEYYGARVYPQAKTDKKNVRIENFAEVRNQGLALAKYAWFLFIDSDEYLSPEAAEEIRGIVARGKSNTHFLYQLPRVYTFNGAPVASLKPIYQLRFFYIPAATPFVKRVHERVKPKAGYALGALKHPEIVPLEDIKTLRQKWVHYLDIEQDKMKDITFARFVRSARANIKKFLKYLIKALLNKIFHPRTSLPLVYDLSNAAYHLQIIWRLAVNLWRNILKHN
ncbi:MAG: glycosyltransferase family 2 protein [bacterium]|nr:glycosyltransferase family 2 protein [bacterium]